MIASNGRATRVVRSNASKSVKVRLLVIGYGNTLRRDDGVGQKLAESVAGLKLPHVCTISCHQLTPELAESVAQAEAVVFVDAARNTDSKATLRKLHPAKSRQTMTHAADAPSLLLLARQVFGHSPRAWSLAVPVEDLSFGDGLSSRAETGLQTALEKIKSLAKQLGHGDT